jgi:uncharacterized membrane protein YfcA
MMDEEGRLGLGYAGGVLGIAGGVIAVPVLGLLGLGQKAAQGTSLVMQLPTGIVGLWHYARRSALNVRLMGTLAFTSATATYLGARLAIHLPGPPLRKGFAMFLALSATFTIPLLTLLFGVSQAQAQGLGLSVVLPAIVIAIPTSGPSPV